MRTGKPKIQFSANLLKQEQKVVAMSWSTSGGLVDWSSSGFKHVFILHLCSMTAISRIDSVKLTKQLNTSKLSVPIFCIFSIFTLEYEYITGR